MAFSQLVWTLGKVCSHFPIVLFFLSFFFFFKAEISSRIPIPLFRPESVHSGSESWNNYGWVFPDELCESSFPWEVPTLCLDSIVSRLRLCWVEGVCMFRCNLPPALLAELPGSLTRHCGNTGAEWTTNRIACWQSTRREHQTCDWKVASSCPGRSEGRLLFFFSRLNCLIKLERNHPDTLTATPGKSNNNVRTKSCSCQCVRLLRLSEIRVHKLISTWEKTTTKNAGRDWFVQPSPNSP